MKRIATHIILILTVMLSAVQVRSQSYPVQTNLYVMAPYSQTYSDYYADGQQRMYVNVLLNDMSQGQLDVVLRFSIKGNNLKLTTNPASPVKPITIQSGRLYRVEGSELAKFLKADQMIAEGRMVDEFRKSGRLPEGYYEVKVEVVEYYRKARVSAPAYSTVWIMQPEPPVWTMPQKNSKLEATNPQFVLFGWMMTGNTTMLQNLSYTFSIYEKPANVNADVVVKSATPIYSEEMKQSTLVYGPDKPLLELGKTYACRIKVVDAEGLVSFKNDGYSDVLVFRYGEECLPPSHISITDVSKNGATVNWVGSDSHYGYDIEVREITEGKSSEWYVWNIDKKQCNYDVKQLSPGSKYECRMRAVCGQRSKGIKSPYSETSEFETYAAGNKKYNCGELVQANKYEDRDPHPWLEEGDIIEANGFLFTIESVSKASERVFSGQCSWYIDLWGVSILCDFIDIQVNKHLQLISGKIVACRDKLKAKAFTRLQSTAYQPVGAQVPNTFKPEKVVAVEETVDSIRIVDGQTLIYVAGKEPTKIAATDNVFVKSADGNYYAVADGKVYPKPSNLNSDTGDIELSYTEKITAMFGYDDNMGAHPGVDAYSDEKKAFAAQYDHYQLHSDDAYATWMAKDGSRAAIAKMTVNGGDPSAVQVRSGGQTVTGFGGSDPNALYLPLITDGLYEAYYTTKDKKEKDVEVVAGQLNVVSYTQQSINVCLVGVNGTRYQNSISELAAYLNQVFGQAVTTINLTTASIEVDKFNGTLSAKESGALSAYNSDMKKLIRKVKKLPDYTDDTYYIMLVAKSDNPALGGFMPVNSNFGFVFAQANSGAGQMNRTIAHELAHGAFRLWHTFSSENLYTAPQGTTHNLMDYNGTNSELYKYQWDYIHNPQGGIVRWMVEESENESVLDNLVHYYLHLISDANANNKNELNLLVENGSIETNEKFRGEISYVKMHLDGGLEKLQPAKIDLIKQNIKKTIRLETENNVTIDPRERTVETDGTEFVKYSFHKVVKGEKTRDIAIQILVKKDEADWLDYFLYGVLPFNDFKQVAELTPSEIKKYRNYIKTLPNKDQAQWYLELQKKVPYHSQRDNKYEKGRTCNQTSIAMALEMLGIPKEEFIEKAEANGMRFTEDEKKMDFEDVIEKYRMTKMKNDSRYEVTTWNKYAELIGLETIGKEHYIDVNLSEIPNELRKEIKGYLENGYGVVMSLFNWKGHVVRVQNIDNNSITIDDPYGELTNLAIRDIPTSMYGGSVYGIGYKGSQNGDNRNITWNDIDINVQTNIGGNIDANEDYEKDFWEKHKDDYMSFDKTENKKKIKYYNSKGCYVKFFFVIKPKENNE